MDVPAQGRGREKAPFVVNGKVGGSVGASRERKVIALPVIVIDSAKERKRVLVRFRCAGVVGVFVQYGVHVLPFDGIYLVSLAGKGEVAADERIEGRARHEAQIMLPAEFVAPVESVVPGNLVLVVVLAGGRSSLSVTPAGKRRRPVLVHVAVKAEEGSLRFDFRMIVNFGNCVSGNGKHAAERILGGFFYMIGGKGYLCTGGVKRIHYGIRGHERREVDG